MGYVAMAKLLTEWRNGAETPWLKCAPVHPLQHALKDLERAYQNFFATRAGFPRFRPARTASWGSSTKPLRMTSHRERKSVVACCVKSGARVFSGVVLTTPAVFTAITGRSASCANGGGVFAETGKSTVLNSRDSLFIWVIRAPQAESNACETGGVRSGYLKLILLASLVTVIVFLTAHVAIVLHIAFGKILPDIIVALDVP
jgi:hypothetical protein